MSKQTFGINTGSSWQEFVYQKGDEFDKNHRDSSAPGDTVGEGRMYARPGDPLCPVVSYIKVTQKDSILSWTIYGRGHVNHTKKMNKYGIVDQLQETTCWQ